MILSLDCETTGLDLHHGAKPFLVTICDEDGQNTYWEWDVDPETREPKIAKEDLSEIQQEIDNAECLILQNAKFDVAALNTVMNVKWDWSKTYDTLYAGHLLTSNEPHDLTYMVSKYLGINLAPYEDEIKTATKTARLIVRREHPNWRIAKQGEPNMPSAKENVWKSDMWLPRVLNPESTLCAEYANSDSCSTIALFRVQKKLLKKRGLWDIYLERLKILPLVYDMEQRGITLNRNRLNELVDDYQSESQSAAVACENIAFGYNYELKLPRSGNNNSLKKFVFDKMKLPVISSSKKTGAPSLDKKVIDSYLSILEGEPLKFIKLLSGKRKRDTALNYMDGYKQYWLGIGDGVYRLHPSLNPTGTKTLRWSSSSPNEQNISKQEGFNLRYAFGPAPSREWWSLDYDNLELRIPAYECGEQAMLDLFENPNTPPYFGSYHLLIFDILHPKLFSRYGAEVKNKFKSTWYQWTKNGNFAELYGAVDRDDGQGTADKAFHVKGAQSKVAERLIEKTKLNQKMITYAEEHGYVETIPDKEVCSERGYPLVCPKTEYDRIKPTIPFNYHVQGTACWIMCRAMVKIQEYFDGIDDCYTIMNVHDEIVLDFPYRPNRGNMPRVRKVKHLMESIGKAIGVKLTVGVDYHPNNWSKSE